MYEVHVSNVGTVHTGHDKEQADFVYDEYTKISDAGRGRAGGQTVSLFTNGDLTKSHDGYLDQSGD